MTSQGQKFPDLDRGHANANEDLGASLEEWLALNLTGIQHFFQNRRKFTVASP
jgi:hypothetical protein